MTAELFVKTPVVPVVVIDDAFKAIDLADALLSAGVEVVEITLRTDAGLESIERISRERSGMCVGAGSIRRRDQIAKSIDAGASFCVSPGYTQKIIAEAQRREASLIPGASSAAELLQLVEYGYDFVKFFPAELSGGIAMLKALSAPIPDVQFFPTGGISAELAGLYLDLDYVPCVGGSWFVPAEKISDADFDWIFNQARKAMEISASVLEKYLQ